MTKRLFAAVILLVGLFAAGSSPALTTTVETGYIIARDATGKLSDDRLKDLANQAQSAVERILEFWSAEPGIDRFGKIRVVFDEPRRKIYYASVFRWANEDGRRVREVRVFGCEGPPQQMVHKLTSALFFHEDKLIRNMMGVFTEERLGNRLSFPGCGFKCDDWVLAFLKLKSFIPLNELGADHESWGMRMGRDGVPMTFDRARQTTAYAEAGSFGGYLIQTYGMDKMKQLYGLSRQGGRPWKDVFGATAQELEAGWLKAVQANEKARDEIAFTLSNLFEGNPNTACLRAQRLGK